MQSVTLYYTVGFGPETPLPMALQQGELPFTVTIAECNLQLNEISCQACIACFSSKHA